MIDMYKINVSVLKSYKKDFDNEFNNFNNTSYSTFSSSYLKKCSDPSVQRMSIQLENFYKKIKKGYKNIDKWWTDYNENIESLENFLSDNGSVGAISESGIRNSANGLPILKKYNIKFSGIVPPATASSNYNAVFANNEVVTAGDVFKSLFSEYDVAAVNANSVISNNNIIGWIDELGSNVSENSENMWAGSTNWKNDVENWWNDFALPVLEKANTIVDDTIESVGAKYGSSAESLASNLVKIGNLVLFTSVMSGFSTGEEDYNSGITNWFEDIGCNVSDTVESVLNNFDDWKSDTEEWVETNALPLLEKATSITNNLVKSVAATIGTFELSLAEGIGKLGESVVDTAAILGTGVVTLGTGFAELTLSLFTGENEFSITKGIWDNTKGFVSKQYVNGWFDSFYENTKIGQFVKENAFGYEGVRSIVTGVSYIASVVVLTIFTAGAGAAAASGTAVTATTAAAATSAGHIAVGTAVAGLGKNVEKAWVEGADIGEGLAAGTLASVWEGVQSFLGAKISNLNMFGKEGLIKALNTSDAKTKVINSISRVILDGVDGGFEAVVLPAINSIYKKGYYDENGEYVEFLEDETILERYGEIFDDNGGWSAFLTEAAIGSASSVIGEAFDLKKYFKDSKKGYLSFSKEFNKSLKQLSDYFGDAGDNVNTLFKRGMTAKQILDELDGQDKIKFQNFLQNTQQGKYLASLSDEEISAMTTYTGGSFNTVNDMLRKEKISGTIVGIDAQKLINDMDSAIAKYGGLETATELYRAVNVGAFIKQKSTYAELFNGIDLDDLNQVYSILSALEGQEFRDLGYMSTSPGYSTSFAKLEDYPIVLEIIADEGTPGAYINQISLYYNRENEFLLARNTKLQMVEVLPPAKDINGLEKIIVKCVVK